MRILGNIIWWIFGGLEAAIGYFTGSLATCHHHYRHTSCSTNIQARTLVPMAFWGRSERWRKSFRLYHHSTQYHLDNLWWFMGMLNPHSFWYPPCHYNYRYSICQATFQNGWTIPCTFGKDVELHF